MRSIYVLTIVLGSVLGLIGGWALHSVTEQACPLRYILPFEPTLTTIKAGDVIPLLVERCNDLDVPLTYTTTHTVASLEGGLGGVLESAKTTLDPGCHEHISYINRVPAALPPGRYYVYGTAEFSTPLRNYSVHWHSAPFEVVK